MSDFPAATDSASRTRWPASRRWAARERRISGSSSTRRRLPAMLLPCRQPRPLADARPPVRGAAHLRDGPHAEAIRSRPLDREPEGARKHGWFGARTQDTPGPDLGLSVPGPIGPGSNRLWDTRGRSGTDLAASNPATRRGARLRPTRSARRADGGPGMRFTTILCATDLSPRSERAVQVAYS